MKVKRSSIVIYGSSRLAADCTRFLLHQQCHIVGYVPSKNPSLPGKMPVGRLSEEPEDATMRISIQYDRKITNLKNAFNLHTGLLPLYGGCDILHHTIKEGALRQGLTFHAMTEYYDAGPILADISYPVAKTDSITTLYEKILILSPGFLLGCVDMVFEMMSNGFDWMQLPGCEPRILKREAGDCPKFKELKRRYG